VLNFPCVHFANGCSRDGLVVHRAAAPRAFRLFLFPTVDATEPAVIAVAKSFEIIERGHFQVGTRQRRGKFLANRVAIFSNRCDAKEKGLSVEKLRARQRQGLDSARSLRKARARRADD
jgi:hypothetical protein